MLQTTKGYQQLYGVQDDTYLVTLKVSNMNDLPAQQRVDVYGVSKDVKGKGDGMVCKILHGLVTEDVGL